MRHSIQVRAQYSLLPSCRKHNHFLRFPVRADPFSLLPSYEVSISSTHSSLHHRKRSATPLTAPLQGRPRMTPNVGSLLPYHRSPSFPPLPSPCHTSRRLNRALHEKVLCFLAHDTTTTAACLHRSPNRCTLQVPLTAHRSARLS